MEMVQRGKLIFVCSSSPRPKWALISLLQVLRQILPSGLFETKFGHMAKKKKKKEENTEGNGKEALDLLL